MEKNKKIKKKFGNAIKGIWTALKEESSLIVHFIVGVLVLIIAGWVRNYLTYESWAIIVLMIGLVIISEIINTTIENLVDWISFKYDIKAKKVKDMAAGFTLVMFILEVAVLSIVLIPAIVQTIESYVR